MEKVEPRYAVFKQHIWKVGSADHEHLLQVTNGTDLTTARNLHEVMSKSDPEGQYAVRRLTKENTGRVFA